MQHLSAEQDISILGKSHEHFDAEHDGPLVANVSNTELLTAGREEQYHSIMHNPSTEVEIVDAIRANIEETFRAAWMKELKAAAQDVSRRLTLSAESRDETLPSADCVIHPCEPRQKKADMPVPPPSSRVMRSTSRPSSSLSSLPTQ